MMSRRTDAVLLFAHFSGVNDHQYLLGATYFLIKSVLFTFDTSAFIRPSWRLHNLLQANNGVLSTLVECAIDYRRASR